MHTGGFSHLGHGITRLESEAMRAGGVLKAIGNHSLPGLIIELHEKLHFDVKAKEELGGKVELEAMGHRAPKFGGALVGKVRIINVLDVDLLELLLWEVGLAEDLTLVSYDA